jgi:hypothetical protein
MMLANYLSAAFCLALGVWNLLQGTLMQAFAGAICFALAAWQVYIIVQL